MTGGGRRTGTMASSMGLLVVVAPQQSLNVLGEPVQPSMVVDAEDFRPSGKACTYPLSRPVQKALEHRTYRTSSSKLREWLLNSGAYRHSMLAMPVWYLPFCWMRVLYSKTYVPLGR